MYRANLELSHVDIPFLLTKYIALLLFLAYFLFNEAQRKLKSRSLPFQTILAGSEQIRRKLSLFHKVLFKI